MENQKINEKKFHGGRRIFAIIDGCLYIAPVNTAVSHWEWLESEKLLGANIDRDLNGITRGFFNDNDLYFYEGDFVITERAETEIFKHLNDLIDKLNIDKNVHLYGGFIKGVVGEKWLPKKDYGALKCLSYYCNAN